ncbi:hypothetical protein D3C85_905220 [compost metagenome]
MVAHGVVHIQAQLRQAEVGEGHAPGILEHLLIFHAEVVEQLRAAVPGAMVLGKEQPVEIIARNLVIGHAQVIGAKAVFGRDIGKARVMGGLRVVQAGYAAILEQLAGVFLHAMGDIQVQVTPRGQFETALPLDHGFAQVIFGQRIFEPQVAAFG